MGATPRWPRSRTWTFAGARLRGRIRRPSSPRPRLADQPGDGRLHGLKSPPVLTDANLDNANAGRSRVARLRAKSNQIASAPEATDERRETNGITSRLLLLYVEQVGGVDAVEQVLARCGMSDRRDELLDENNWFSYDGKIALFEAAAEVLGDPNVMLSVSSQALTLKVGGGLKIGRAS